ncbi:MAG: hypothetical protein AB1815_10045 [Bacillota bacterium]
MNVPFPKNNLLFLVAGLLVILYAFVLKGQLGDCVRLGAEITSLQRQLAEARTLAGSLEAEERALAAARTELSQHQNNLNGQPDGGLYLAALSEEALAAGVAVSEFLAGDCKDLPTYRESSIQLIVTGDYPRVLAFLRRALEPGRAEIDELHIIDASLAPAESSGRGALVFPAGTGPEKGVVVARISLKIFSAPVGDPKAPAIPPAQLPLGRPNIFIEAIPLTPAENAKKLPPLAGTA